MKQTKKATNKTTSAKNKKNTSAVAVNKKPASKNKKYKQQGGNTPFVSEVNKFAPHVTNINDSLCINKSVIKDLFFALKDVVTHDAHVVKTKNL
jgi:hypothetical protein